jgi:hypothetical protein
MSGSNSSGRISGAAAEALPEPLVLTVHTLATPDLSAGEAARRTRAGRLKMLLVLAICAAPVIASYLMFYVVRPGAAANYGSLIQPTRSLPALTLHTPAGLPVVASALKGQWLLVAVGPAACADGCQRRLYLQRQLREMLGRDRDRLDKVWLVTDAAPLESGLLEALQATPGMTVLRADAAAVARWLVPEVGRALEEHLYLVDPMGEWMMRMPAEPDPLRVKRDLDRLLRASASWDRAGREP